MNNPVSSPNKTLQTVDKALNVLNHFSAETPEFGLSELARAAGMDKATALRILNSFCAHGFVEQDPATRKFRLGPAVLRIARIRESTVPLTTIIQPILNRLSAATGETAHASLPDGNELVTMAIAVPHRSTRVFVDPATRLPFHATASGIIYLACIEPALREKHLAGLQLSKHTDMTITSLGDLKRQIDEAARRGFAKADRTFETDTVGIAAAYMDAAGHARGTIAVAAVAARSNDTLLQSVIAEVKSSAAEATRLLGGIPGGDH